MKIENAIFQDLESYGEESIFKMAIKVIDFFCKISYYGFSSVSH